MDWLPPGVTVVNNRGAHAAKGGEFGLMAMLMLHNHLPPILANQRRRHWESLFSTPVSGKTLLVVGTGHIGRGAARCCRALGVHVIGVSRHGRAVEEVDEAYPVADLDRVLPRADFVFVATPLTPETRNLLDRRRQSLLKPGSGSGERRARRHRGLRGARRQPALRPISRAPSSTSSTRSPCLRIRSCGMSPTCS